MVRIFANDVTNKGLISKIHKQLIQLNNKKTNNPVKKISKRFKEPFLQRIPKTTNRHVKRCSALLAFREMQIKTTLRYHLTPVITVILKNK